jgi:putative Mg2+ transporter-C (MgtC) family protein
MEDIIGRLALDAGALRLDLLGRLLLAALLGGLVGLEREWSGKPAGLRTNLLICVGAALLTQLSFTVARSGIGTVSDPARIAAQIVSGIGFLGAGTIIQSRVGVTGLTTAATLWVVAAIGMAVGAGAYVEAVGATALVVAALLVLGRLEGRLVRQVEGLVQVELAAEVVNAGRVRALLEKDLQVVLVEIERLEEGVLATYRIQGHPRNWADVVTRVSGIDGVRSVRRV